MRPYDREQDGDDRDQRAHIARIEADELPDLIDAADTMATDYEHAIHILHSWCYGMPNIGVGSYTAILMEHMPAPEAQARAHMVNRVLTEVCRDN